LSDGAIAHSLIVSQFIFCSGSGSLSILFLASTEDSLVKPFLDLWARRNSPTVEQPGYPEQKTN